MKYLLLMLLTFSVFAKSYEFQGTAKNEDGSLAYIEKHKITFNKDDKIIISETEYFFKDKKIATLYNNYEENDYTPDHDFEDFRFDYTYGLDFKSDKIIMYKKGKDYNEQEEIELNKNSISSQGFNIYLSTKLKKVKNGTVFDFIIPGKMTRVDFKVTSKAKDDKIRFILEADSFFIRMVAPKMIIDYTYDGRIRYYKGPSNLPDNEEESQNVEITYQYPEDKNK